ncbi:MAG: phosphatidylserine/phosphatidylglycerophosphate/cardiolipin synthase family protein [Candidatus Hydrothermarchaeales archaeon]
MDKKVVVFLLILISFQPLYAEEFYVHEITTFVSPDSSYTSLSEFIDDADNSLYISVYEFDDPHIAVLVKGALQRGVNVEIILEGKPVGGISKNERGIIKELLGKGAHVYFHGDERINFAHAKYSIADNESLLITSENFGDTGFSKDGSYGNRGWGIIVEDPELASYFVDVFLDDLKDSEKAYVTGKVYIDRSTPKGSYRPRFDSRRYSGTFIVEPIVAPENAVDAILGLLNSAKRSVYIEQFYIYKYWGSRIGGSVKASPNLFLEAAIDAARRGCEVKILLDSTWYNVKKDDPVSNYHTVEYVNNVAKEENLKLEAKLTDLKRAGFVKMHNKGVIVDDEKVLVTSINWNENSPTRNREVGVIVHGDVAKYYSDVFMHDWAGKERGVVPYALLILIGVSLALAVIYMSRRRRENR